MEFDSWMLWTLRAPRVIGGSLALLTAYRILRCASVAPWMASSGMF